MLDGACIAPVADMPAHEVFQERPVELSGAQLLDAPLGLGERVAADAEEVDTGTRLLAERAS